MNKIEKHTYAIEVTDTFGGEANYSWVRRYRYKAKSKLGAMQMLAREHGGGWRIDFDCGDTARYNMPGVCICAFVIYVDSSLEG